jgi:hypothetical protein
VSIKHAMKHIHTDTAGVTHLDAYFTYLESVRDQLPAAVAAFATDSGRYSLDGPGTLHDAWLEATEVREPATGRRQELRRTEIVLRFLGPFHDRHHVLRYEDVARYRMEVADAVRGHGDLHTHEVRLGQGGAVIHELVFAGGGVIEIECARFSHVEEPVRAPSRGAV